MANKRKKIIVSIVAFLMIVAVGLYFILPKMLADEVYPLNYQALICKYSAKYNVDPTLVAAVIYVESRFDPNAQSGTGADGLMQMMKNSTFKTMLAEVGRPANSDIFDPEVSIDTGTAHLRDLLIWSHGDLDLAILAYNLGTGGASVVRQAGGANAVSNYGYVKKVRRAMTIYGSIYPRELCITSSPVQLQETNQQEKQAEIRGFFWVQLFQNVFHF